LRGQLCKFFKSLFWLGVKNFVAKKLLDSLLFVFRKSRGDSFNLTGGGRKGI